MIQNEDVKEVGFPSCVQEKLSMHYLPYTVSDIGDAVPNKTALVF